MEEKKEETARETGEETMIEAKRLYEHELTQLVRDGFLRISCPHCPNIIFAWSNRNACPCHRARCLQCKQGSSYHVELKKTKEDYRARLFVFDDTYEDFLEAFNSRKDCQILMEEEEE